MEEKVQQHLSGMSRLARGNKSEVTGEVVDLHVELEQLWTDMMKDFKVIKKEIFRLAEQGLTFNKGSHLLG